MTVIVQAKPLQLQMTGYTNLYTLLIPMPMAGTPLHTTTIRQLYELVCWHYNDWYTGQYIVTGYFYYGNHIRAGYRSR